MDHNLYTKYLNLTGRLTLIKTLTCGFWVGNSRNLGYGNGGYNLGYGNGGYRGRLFWVAFPGGHEVFYRRVKGGSLGGEKKKISQR